MNDDVKNRIEECKEKELTTLKLEGLQLSEIPVEVYELTHLTTLNLMENNIREVPADIVKLQNIEELWLTANLLTTIPIELSQLPKLRRLHLSDNKLTEFPDELIESETISHLCIRRNELTELPENIESLTIRDVQLDSNKITSIPINYKNADFFLTLGLEDNPLEDPHIDIFNAGISVLLKFLFEREKGRTFSFPITDALKTTFKQYLNYFTDFIQNTKGKKIGFEVRDVSDGLEIEIKTENDSDLEIEEVRVFMEEYVGFIKTSIDDIAPKFEIAIDEPRKELAIIELRSQIRHLQTQLELKATAQQVLVEDRDRYYNLLLNLTSNPVKIEVQNDNSSRNMMLQQTVNISAISENLPKLISEIQDIRKHIPADESQVLQDLIDIDTSLLELDECKIDQKGIKKAPFRKIKRILEEINNEESTLNKTIKASHKAIGAAQALGKTYNDFAEWLALPQVPKLFLGKK